MKVKDILQEEFVDYAKTGYSDNIYPIYKNPTVKEMKEVRKTQGKGDDELRGIIDFDNKNFYLFPANLLHFIVAGKYTRDVENATNIMCEFIPSKKILEIKEINYVKGEKRSLEEQWLKKYLEL
jgi:hypothetical protein